MRFELADRETKDGITTNGFVSRIEVKYAT
jgi:hypothetical protein